MKRNTYRQQEYSKQNNNTRNFQSTRHLTIITLCSLVILFSSCRHISNPERPNFLVIFVDDLTYRAVGYNNPIVQTPSIDSLAKQGMIFQNLYISTPICAASRASIMTGKFPQENGSVALDQKNFEKTVCNDITFPSLPRLFNQGGYETWFSGKSHLGPAENYGFQKAKIFRDFHDSASFDLAHEYIETYNGEKPFFLWLAPRQPHVPLHPGEKWLALYDTAQISLDPNFLIEPYKKSIFNQGLPGELFYRDSDYTDNWKNLPAGPPRPEGIMRDYIKAYYATVSHLDRQIGDLINSIKAEGFLENTVVVFLSDNGYFLGNHGLGNKITMHEESVRVPAFIYYNELKQKGIECDEIVSSLDLVPTLLELAQIKVPESVSGKSILPIFSNPDHAINEYVVSECVGVEGKVGEGHRMIRTKKWKYILSGVNDEAIFDVQADPYEQKNLLGIDSERDNKMRGYMIEWMDKVNDKHERPGMK